MTESAPCSAVDAFDLPDWLGTDPVTWSAVGPLRHGIVHGEARFDAALYALLPDDLQRTWAP